MDKTFAPFDTLRSIETVPEAQQKSDGLHDSESTSVACWDPKFQKRHQN